MTNSWVCLDASFVVQMIVAPESENAAMVERWLSAGTTLAAPTLLFYEVTNALYQYLRHGWLDVSSVELAQLAALTMPISLFGSSELHLRAIHLATDFNLPATYDGHYLAVAESLDADLWTADKRLYRTMEDRPIRVRIL